MACRIAGMVGCGGGHRILFSAPAAARGRGWRTSAVTLTNRALLDQARFQLRQGDVGDLGHLLFQVGEFDSHPEQSPDGSI